MTQGKTNILPIILRVVSLFLNFIAMTPLSFMLFVVVSFMAIIFINLSSPFETHLIQSNYTSSMSMSFDETDILQYLGIANAILLVIKKLVFRNLKSKQKEGGSFFRDNKFILLTLLFAVATLSALSPIARPGARDILGVLFAFWIIGITMGYLYHFLMSVVSKMDSLLEEKASSYQK